MGFKPSPRCTANTGTSLHGHGCSFSADCYLISTFRYVFPCTSPNRLSPFFFKHFLVHKASKTCVHRSSLKDNVPDMLPVLSPYVEKKAAQGEKKDEKPDQRKGYYVKRDVFHCLVLSDCVVLHNYTVLRCKSQGKFILFLL